MAQVAKILAAASVYILTQKKFIPEYCTFPCNFRVIDMLMAFSGDGKADPVSGSRFLGTIIFGHFRNPLSDIFAIYPTYVLSAKYPTHQGVIRHYFRQFHQNSAVFCVIPPLLYSLVFCGTATACPFLQVWRFIRHAF